MAQVLVVLPDHDFDPTEVAVPWSRLRDGGHDVTFATELGLRSPEADPRLLAGVLFGQLGAEPAAKQLFEEMTKSEAFRRPIPWSGLTVSDFGGLILPGGHAPRMRQYLESRALQETVSAFWRLGRPVGAICHGVVVLARTIDPETGRSVIAAKRTTALTKSLERVAYFATAWRLGRYYRTYRAYVQDEVTSVLDNRSQFEIGPRRIRRDTESTDTTGFTVLDGHYLSARWPGDAYTFAGRFEELLHTV